MKISFEFCDDEQDQIEIFKKAEDFYLALCDLDNYLRNIQKYHDRIPDDLIERCRDLITESGVHKIL